MKHYFRRLWRAITNKNYYPYYYEENPYPIVWELDNYIVNMVRVNLPNYKMGYPANFSESEREKVRLRLIELSEKICEGYKMRYRYGTGSLEEKQGYSMQDLANAEKEFGKLLGENLFYLRD